MATATLLTVLALVAAGFPTALPAGASPAILSPTPSPTAEETRSEAAIAERAQDQSAEQPRVPWWVHRTDGDEGGRGGADLRAALARQNQERAALRGLLGDNRWRQLDAARFALELDDLDLTEERRNDRRWHAEIEDALRSNFLKLVRENAEQALGLEALLERHLTRVRPAKTARGLDSSTDKVLRLRYSPRFSFGSHPKVGLKFRLSRPPSPVWSRMNLRLEQGLNGDDLSLRLAFEEQSRDFSFKFASDDRRQGMLFELNARFSF